MSPTDPEFPTDLNPCLAVNHGVGIREREGERDKDMISFFSLLGREGINTERSG